MRNTAPAMVLGARRVERLDELAGEIRQRGGQAVTCATDVARRADLERLIARAVAAFGRLDVLLSNAGVSKIGLDSSINDHEVRERIRGNMNDFGMAPEAVARAVALAIGQPHDVEIGEITIRPTVEG